MKSLFLAIAALSLLTTTVEAGTTCTTSCYGSGQYRTCTTRCN